MTALDDVTDYDHNRGSVFLLHVGLMPIGSRVNLKYVLEMEVK